MNTQQNGNGYNRYLGEVAWNCMWSDNDVGADQLIPCHGIITTVSSRKLASKQPLSTAVVSFWVAEKWLDESVGSAELVTPTVLRSTGSWPKPDAFSGFGWNAANEQLYLNIHYKKGAYICRLHKPPGSDFRHVFRLMFLGPASINTYTQPASTPRLPSKRPQQGAPPLGTFDLTTIGLSEFGAG